MKNKEFSDEKILHNKFKHLHKNGEWFKPDNELIEFIKEYTVPYFDLVKPVDQHWSFESKSSYMMKIDWKKYDRLKDLRMTNRQIAELFGISYTTLHNRIRERKCDNEYALIAKELGITYGTLRNKLYRIKS